ncbi:T9SS type A sorting domain-containing protein [Lutibacter sp.]|uniref:T9SS type A sorting domain-containing protein n=1 Tax=Lutibacter sp. TaxID=1925666 RepID=UPI00356A98FA
MKTTKLLLILFLFTSLIYGQENKSKKVDWSKMGNNKSASFKEVQDDFYQYWEGKTPKKGQGYKIFKRWEYQAKDRVYPSGNLDLLSSTYSNYLEWEKNYTSKQNNNLSKDQLSLKSTTSNWTTLNGTSIPTGYDSGTGRLTFITFDPIDSSKMYVGSPDGGLWKTTDGGANWTTNTDFLTIIGCSGLVIHPTNTNLMYLATGDRETDRRSIGVLKSTDGGTTWSTTSLSWTDDDNYKITKIVMDPTNPLIMMVTTDGGVFKTTDGWATNTHTGTYDYFYDIEFKPTNLATPPSPTAVVYASSTNKIYKSTDNGTTWTAATGLPTSDVSRIELAVTKHNESKVYAVLGNSTNGLKGVYISTDSGASFSLKYNSINLLHADATPPSSPTPGWNGGQASHDLAIAVSPINQDLITIGGINQWQSTDGGTNWSRITYWLGLNPAYPTYVYDTKPYIHADIQYIAYSPHDDTTLYSTCDGGISKGILDGQSTWEDISNNIAVGQQTSISLSATDQNLFFTGLQDIGSLISTSPGSWSVLGGGDGEDGFIDRTNNNIKIYSTVNGEFSRNKNGVVSGYTKLNSEWFTPIHQDPTDANLVYVGGRPALYKSTNMLSNPDYVDPTWTALGTPNAGKNILRFEIAPSNNHIIYAITDNMISKSINSGVNWTNVTGTLPVANAKLKNLAISNTDPLKVWVVFSGYNATTKVFKTTDGGTTWVNLNSDTLPNLPINTIVHVKNSTNDAVYLGADIGVYYIDNSQSSWTQYATDLPKNSVQDLEIFYTSTATGKLRAATYGRGTWQADINFSTLGIGEIHVPISDILTLYPNPVTNGSLNIKLKDASAKYDYIIYNIAGSKITNGKLENIDNIIPLNNAVNGLYIIKLINGNKVSTQKFLIKN